MGGNDVFEVGFTTPRDLARANKRELSHGGGFVASSQVPDVFSPVVVRYVLPDVPSVEVPGRVVNVQPGSGFFVQFERGDALEALKSAIELVRALSGEESHGGGGPVPMPSAAPPLPPEDTDQADDEAEGDSDDEGLPPAFTSPSMKPVWELIDVGSEVPLHRQVADLSVPDKLRLARQANRPVRALLARDQEKRIHLPLVKNPKVGIDELVEWSAMPGLSPQALRWMSTQKRIARNPQLQLNLVVNPSTPRDVATRFLKLLPLATVRKVARSSRVREAVARAARKRLMEEDR